MTKADPAAITAYIQKLVGPSSEANTNKIYCDVIIITQTLVGPSSEANKRFIVTS